MTFLMPIYHKMKQHFRDKIRSIQKLSKYVFYKKWGPDIIFLNKFFLERFGRYLTQKIDFKSPDFIIFDATVPSQHYRYKNKHFAALDSFVKNKACVNCVGLNINE